MKKQLSGNSSACVQMVPGMLLTALFSTCSTAALAQAPGGPQADQTTAAPVPGASPVPGESGLSGLEEVIVTAQRREESIQNVGIAINVISGDMINQMNITRAADVALLVPGVSTAQTQPGSSSSFSIRGVTQNSTAIHQEGPVALYMDDAYISNAQFQSPSLFDVQRVEVLKGPQGTLFGRNATGGLVHIISKRPTDTAEGYMDFSYGSYNEIRAEGAVSGPLADGVNGRIAFLSHRYDPIYENPVSNDYGNLQSIATRAQLEIKPSDDLDILLLGYYGRDQANSGGVYQSVPAIAVFDGAGQQIDVRRLGANETARTIVNGVATGTRPCAGCNFFGYRDPDGPDEISAYGPIGVVGGSESVFFSGDPDNTDLKQYSGTANVTWNRGDLSITSVTDARHYGSESVIPLQFGGPVNGVDPVQYYQTADVDQLSQELRGNLDLGALRATAGGYYLDIDGYWTTANGPLPGNIDIFEYHAIRTKSLSAFANLEYDITPTITLIGGGRYIDETQKLDTQGDVRSSPTDIVSVFGRFNTSISPLAENTFGLYSWRAALNWKPTSTTLGYLSANRGVKSGGFNIPTPNSFTTFPFENYPYEPENLMAYEIGVKQEFLGGSMRAELSAFYYDYNDYQASFSINLVRSIYNLQSTIKGIDFQISGRPFDNFFASFGGTYTDGVIKDVQITPTLIKDVPVTFTPDLKLVAVARYTIPIGANELQLQLDGQHSSSYTTSLFALSALNQKEFTVLNTNVSYLIGNVELSGFVRNVTDRRYISTANDLAASRGEAFIGYSKPRWYGVGIGYKW